MFTAVIQRNGSSETYCVAVVIGSEFTFCVWSGGFWGPWLISLTVPLIGTAGCLDFVHIRVFFFLHTEHDFRKFGLFHSEVTRMYGV